MPELVKGYYSQRDDQGRVISCEEQELYKGDLNEAVDISARVVAQADGDRRGDSNRSSVGANAGQARQGFKRRAGCR